MKKTDFFAWCAAFFATLVLGVQLGIGIGVLTSMVLIVLRTARPNFAVLGRLPRSNIFRDVRRYTEAAPIPGVVIFRFDASLHFANKVVSMSMSMHMYMVHGLPIRCVAPLCEQGRLHVHMTCTW